MSRYRLTYVSNGEERSFTIKAASPADALAKARALPWAPGCGPVGRPTRDDHSFMTPLLVLAAIAASLAAPMSFIALERWQTGDPQVIASSD